MGGHGWFLWRPVPSLLSPLRTDLAGAHLAGVGALSRALPLDLGRTLFSSRCCPVNLQSSFHHHHTHYTHSPHHRHPIPRCQCPISTRTIAGLCVNARAVLSVCGHV